MLIKEFGSKNNPTIILIHGGGLSWWSLKPVIEQLKEKYHVVTPIIDGHGEDFSNPFVSIEETAKQLITYINKYHEVTIQFKKLDPKVLVWHISAPAS